MNNMTDTVKHLIIINVLLFIASNFFMPNLYNSLPLYCFGTDFFHFYQMITHMFMHSQINDIHNISLSDFMHIGFNMYALYSFGSILEHFWGPKKFLFYYIACGLGAALTFNLVNYFSGDYGASAVGASGAIYGLLVGFGFMFPDQKLALMFVPVPIKARYFIPGLIAMDLFLGFNGQSLFGFGGTGIAHFAHIGGALFGFIIMWIWRNNRFNHSRWN
jgi:membrane associated rhomboid family serine protease